MGTDDLGVGRRQGLVGQAELRREVAAQVVETRIGPCRQAMQHVVRGRLLEV
jgi:hypothetical protein